MEGEHIGKEKWPQGNELTLVLRDEELKAGSALKVRQQRRALADATWKKKRQKSIFDCFYQKYAKSYTLGETEMI